MSIGISENFKQSFAFTKENLVGKILNWVILFVLVLLSGIYLAELLPNLAILWAILGIAASIITYGIIVRIYAGGEVTFGSFGTLVKKGIGYFIAAFVYSIPAYILMVIALVIMLVPLAGDNPGVLATGIAAGILILIFALILAILATAFIIPAAVNYAHSTGIGGAFRFSEIFARLEKAGWGEFIGSFLIFLIIQMVVVIPEAILLTLGFPIVGGIITAVINPIIIVLQAKYFANLLS